LPFRLHPQLIKTETKWILNFPTKNKWRSKSKLEFVVEGLEYLVSHYQDWGITAIALPELGCGLGGLDWKVVQLIMVRLLGNLDIPVEIWVSASFEHVDPEAASRKRKGRHPAVGQRQLL
jgi:O-acetyl-ADP-ribose deacetylase (regulator of RNase III)